jgi:hypothetical protein
MVNKSQIKKKSPRKKITILIILAICFSLLATPVYASYYSLSEADFPSPNLSFESPDQEVQFIQKECLLIFTGQPLLILLSLIETGFFYLNRALSWEAPSSDQKFSFLRC